MIDIAKRVEEAVKNFKSGYNCCQSVVLAYGDITTLDAKTIAIIAAPYGAGMGRLREVCGSVSGMFMVSGFVFDASDPTNNEAKKVAYQAVQTLAKKFKEKNGSIVCRELLGITEKQCPPTPEPRTEEYYKKRPCAEYVADCARLIGEMINDIEKK